MKFSHSHDSSHTNIFGLFNIVWPKKSPADNPSDNSADQPVEPSVYQEIISAEAYIYHIRAKRRLRAVNNLICVLLLSATLAYGLTSILVGIIFLPNQDSFRVWDEYFSGKYIDVTSSVKDLQEILVPTNKPHIYNAYINATFSYENLVAIDHAAQKSNAEVVAIYKSASGTYDIFWLNRDAIHACVANSADLSSNSIFTTTPRLINTASSSSVLICFVQNLSFTFHSPSLISGYLTFTVFLAFIALVVIFVLILIERRISVHESCLSRLAPVDIYRANDDNPDNPADFDSPSEAPANPEDSAS